MDNYNDNDKFEYETTSTTETDYMTPAEFAREFKTRVSTESAEEFPAADEDYATYELDETANNLQTAEQAATYDEDCDGTECFPEYTVDDEYDNEYAEDYDVYDETTDEPDYGVNDNFDYDGSDEQAATCDETTCYCTGESAREKCKLDDYEIISDVLGSEKQLVKLYSTALCEASEEPFRNLIRENLDDAAADQYKAFEYMQERGLYPTEQASEQDICQAKQCLQPLCGNDGSDWHN